MTQKMTWNERRQMHLDLHQQHYHAAMDALHKFSETHDYKFYLLHESEYKLSNKHWGIAEAMWTRKYGKI